jgi:hypothetical protein
MQLNNEVLEQLQDALLDAFSKPELAQVVGFVLGKDLDEIVGGATPEEIVHDLIKWSEGNNRAGDLVKGVVARNPGDDKLSAFADWYLPEQDAAGPPNLKQPPSQAIGTEPEKSGIDERAAPAPSGGNHASG